MSGIYGVEDLKKREASYQTVDGDVLEEADVCIIGSGAAGSVLAKKLTEAGRSVVLLERGGYFEGEDMNQRDEDMLPLLWKNSGANFSDDLRTAIAQGSCLGGSTVINDAVCFPIPDLVKREWRGLGVDISDEEWDLATVEASEMLNVSAVGEDEININNNLLRKGCDMMGYENHGPNLRNCVSCMGCGLCHLGCHYETKQDMRVTYLQSSERPRVEFEDILQLLGGEDNGIWRHRRRRRGELPRSDRKRPLQAEGQLQDCDHSCGIHSLNGASAEELHS